LPQRIFSLKKWKKSVGSSKLCRNSPRKENRDLTGKYVLKGHVEAGFSWPIDALSATT
jgi:hypothetical protein